MVKTTLGFLSALTVEAMLIYPLANLEMAKNAVYQAGWKCGFANVHHPNVTAGMQFPRSTKILVKKHQIHQHFRETTCPFSQIHQNLAKKILRSTILSPKLPNKSGSKRWFNRKPWPARPPEQSANSPGSSPGNWRSFWRKIVEFVVRCWKKNMGFP